MTTGNDLEDSKKAKAQDLSDMPQGIKDLIAMPPGGQVANAPEAGASAPKGAASKPRQKTQKEQALDSLAARRQEIIEQLKAKNPVASEARKKLASLIPSIRGKGASRVLALAEEERKLEFAISTEAYTPKKEKELLKRMREIHTELSKHKELDATRKLADAERAALSAVVSDIRALERDLAAVRRQCDAAYAEVLAERKADYEKRQQKRAGREKQRFEDLQRHVRAEKKRSEDSEVRKYMKDYDDTLSMEEICVFEKKEKKKEGDG